MNRSADWFAFLKWITAHRHSVILVVIWLRRMRLKFNIKHLLALMLVVSIGTVLQLRLAQVISTFKHDIEDVESRMHRDAIRTLSNEFPAMAAARHSMSVDGINLDSSTTIMDYCLFRRTVKCRYNLNTGYLRREIAHGRTPKHMRVDEYYVDVPSQHQVQQTIRLTATPFGYKIENQ